MMYVLEDQGSRPYMEDRHYIERNFIPDYDLYCIFDGHGNDNISKFLTLYFKDILRNELYSQETHQQGMARGFHNAFQKMNDVIPKDIGWMSASTALVILQSKTHVWVANAGDCRAIMNGVIENEAMQISIDHKPNDQREHDRIVEVGGFVAFDPMGTARVNGNLSVSRSFGDFYLAPSVTWIPDIFNFQIQEKHRFVFAASDGIYDTVKNEEIVAIMNGELKVDKHISEQLRVSCMKVLHLARIRGSGDNITIILNLFS